MKYESWLMLMCLLSVFCLSGCRTATPPEDGTTTEARGSLAPKQVDIRGMIVMSRYREGQMILEIQGRAPSPNSRYDRAYILVLPTTQIIGLDGKSVYMNELINGVQVAALLRGRGQGEFEGIGIARKVWVEELNYEP